MDQRWILKLLSTNHPPTTLNFMTRSSQPASRKIYNYTPSLYDRGVCYILHTCNPSSSTGSSLGRPHGSCAAEPGRRARTWWPPCTLLRQCACLGSQAQASHLMAPKDQTSLDRSCQGDCSAWRCSREHFEGAGKRIVDYLVIRNATKDITENNQICVTITENIEKML